MRFFHNMFKRKRLLLCFRLSARGAVTSGINVFFEMLDESFVEQVHLIPLLY